MSYRMVKPNLKFWVQVITSMCGRDQERYNSEYLQPFVKYCGGSIMFWSGISVSGWRARQNLRNCEQNFVPTDFDPPCSVIWKASTITY